MNQNRKQKIEILELYLNRLSEIYNELALQDFSDAIYVDSVIDRAKENVLSIRNDSMIFFRTNNFREEEDEIFNEALLKENMTVREIRNVISKMRSIIAAVIFQVQSQQSYTQIEELEEYKKEIDELLNKLTGQKATTITLYSGYGKKVSDWRNVRDYAK